MADVKILEEQLKQLDNIEPKDLSSWRSETLPIIAEFFPKKSSQYEQFIHIAWLADAYNLEHVQEFQNCLRGFIKCLSVRAISNKKTDSNNNPIVINNNPNFSQTQTQNQSQTQTLNIEDIIRDGLPPKDMREIATILKTAEPEETKLEKIGAILQKVGIGVMSAVLSRIITTSLNMF